MKLTNGPISFMVELQGLIAQSTMESKLGAAALTMKEAVFCKNMMKELRFKDGFDGVPLYIKKPALHVAGNRTSFSRAKHVTLRYLFVQELVEGRHDHHPLRQDKLADIGVKHLNKQHHRELINKIRSSGA